VAVVMVVVGRRIHLGRVTVPPPPSVGTQESEESMSSSTVLVCSLPEVWGGLLLQHREGQSFRNVICQGSRESIYDVDIRRDRRGRYGFFFPLKKEMRTVRYSSTAVRSCSACVHGCAGSRSRFLFFFFFLFPLCFPTVLYRVLSYLFFVHL